MVKMQVFYLNPIINDDLTKLTSCFTLIDSVFGKGLHRHLQISFFPQMLKEVIAKNDLKIERKTADTI